MGIRFDLRRMRYVPVLLAIGVLASPIMGESHTETAGVAEKATLRFQSVPGATYRFGGPVGHRIKANVDAWLLVAPDANPGMLEMFRRRDRNPRPELVPWAGEFIGKYLTSAIPARQLTDRKELDETVGRLVKEFLHTQADDGYLGPFPREERLRGHWDLWGHYHALYALLLWHDATGDGTALQGAVRAADCICATYLDTGRRVLDAGSPEMNMAVIHALAMLYRRTGKPSYLRMVREIEKDWESAGDYLRTGVAGVPFYRTPRPRWESLHDLQGLVELYRITGAEAYKKAFISHWTTIMQHDRHPSGGFTTGERAIGNPYTEGAIETCCTIAWMAMTVDMLRLTGDSRAADELELSFWNAALGAQHPSGRWWTYDTPINGVRRASAHAIVFQARHGTPELNCCSVNGPRALSLLADWAVMRDGDGLILNYYGPSCAHVTLRDGTRVTLAQETEYPASGRVTVTVGLPGPKPGPGNPSANPPATTVRQKRFPIAVRIPHWSTRTRVRVMDAGGSSTVAADRSVPPGRYHTLDRIWKDGDRVEIQMDMSPRHWSGELARSGHAAVFTGPLLLAFDPHFDERDTDSIPTIDMSHLTLDPVAAKRPEGPGLFAPIALYQVSGDQGLSGDQGSTPTLCDFASAGAHGTDYVAWLPATRAAPPPPVIIRPLSGQAVAAGPVLFEWAGPRWSEVKDRTFRCIVSSDPQGRDILYQRDDIRKRHHVARLGLDEGTYYVEVSAVNQHGTKANVGGPRAFTIDASLTNTVDEERDAYRVGPGGLLVASPLDGTGKTTFGRLLEEHNTQSAFDRFGQRDGAVAFSEAGSRIRYHVPSFPDEDYTFLAWVRPKGIPTTRLHQVMSAWCAGMDDPLRVVLHKDRIFARIEAGRAYSTEGVPIDNDGWRYVAAVKQGGTLTLFVNGNRMSSVHVPALVPSAATDFAIGANPHFGGNEYFVGVIDDFSLYARALTDAEIATAYSKGRGPSAGTR